MQQETLDIERVVRQVLAELGLVSNGESAPTEQADAASNDPRELVLAGRVITLSAVEGRLEDICRLTVPAGAVVTPAVRDEVRQRDIVLTFASASASQDGPAAGNRINLIVTAVGTGLAPETVSEMLQNEAVEVTADRCDCLIRATDELAGQLAEPNRLAMLITKHTAAALCLANRQAGVRAVLGIDATTTTADIDATGANLLVVDPRAVGPFQLKQMATRFCRGGPAVCPATFKDRLA